MRRRWLNTIVLLSLWVGTTACSKDKNPSEDPINIDEICNEQTKHYVACESLGSDVSPEEVTMDCKQDIEQAHGECKQTKANLAQCRSQIPCEELQQGKDCDDELQQLAQHCSDDK